MNRFFVLVFVFLFTTLSCSNDDDTSSDPDVNIPDLSGSWNMVNVTGGFVGINHDFSNGIIIWNFNETNKTITITNNNTDDSVEDLLPTGTYDYSLVSIQGNQELILDGVNRGNFEVTASELIIEQQIRDGFRYTFRR
ncbi:hypothetical protein [Aquimarina celericrescens]|uniref:Lipocalin-like domain-containing protein n=1 Tax=Aquimarina celericrescens TaxID=1964542 RepID=A0ABW5AQQ1_9FLAO|nr:hypothetical protein [Aquimarina celericrescens]